MAKTVESKTRPNSQAITRALQALERSGKLTAEDVVAAARKRESPLHGCFEWDDGKAAECWRLEQARGLIRSVQINVTVDEGRMISVPVYVRDPAVRADDQGYASLSSIMKNPDAARAALYVELTRVEGLMARAENIAEACGLLDDVQRVARRVKALRKRTQPQAQA